MYDYRNKVIGYDADIIKIVAKRTGLKILFELGKWDEIQDRARKREFDGLTSAIQTKERAKIYNSSKQYLNYTSLIIVKKGNPAGIFSIEDISGKRVALQKGNASKEILLEEGKKVEFVYFDTIHELIKAIVSGKADFTILDESAFYVARQLMLESMIEAPFTVGEGHTLHFLLRKDWPELVSIINKGINSIPDETKNSIKNKWFGLSDLEIKNVEKEQFSYAKKTIKQKAEDVARQVEIYLTAYPDKTLKDLQNDPEFQKIAIQPVGKTGYTVISDYNNLVILFHPNKNLIGFELEDMSSDYPAMWKLMEQAKGGNDVSGQYKFPDLNGVDKDKYLYLKISTVKTADGVGMWVAATTYLDEYEIIESQKEKNERLPIIPVAWILGFIIFVVLFLLILNKLNIVKFEKNAIVLVLAIALLLIVGLFIFNAYNISNNLKKTAIENYFDTLKATASAKHVNIDQHVTHMKSSFKVLSSRKTISNEDLMKIIKLGEDFTEIFIIGSNGKITHSSDISDIGNSRLTAPHFKNTKPGIYIKPLYLSETIGEVSFTISAPYNKGVLVARLNLNHIHEIISKKEGL
jgi:ABC-type amino acid transport substrate-binding protein